MQKLMYDAMVNAEEMNRLRDDLAALDIPESALHAALQGSMYEAAERFQNALAPVQTGTLRPSVKAVKGYDNNAAKAERRRKQRAKRQRKAPSS